MSGEDHRSLLEESLQRNGELRLPSIGSSMWPELRPGDDLQLARLAWEDVAPGDILVFTGESPGTARLTLVAHRVLKTYMEGDRPMLLTKGDNRTFADPPVAFAQVIGRVERATRDGAEVYARANARDRRIARRSLLQEQVWSLFSTRVLGETTVGPETHAVCQVLGFQLGWILKPDLPEGLDWEALYELGRDGRLTPAMSNLPIPGAPAWFQERCRRDLRENQAQQMLLYGELGAMLTAFTGAGLTVLLVKGPTIADRVYPNPAWRPMVDIDLVVKPGDWAAALRVLRELGFTPEESDWSGLTETLTGQVALLKPLGPTVAAVEIHRDLRMLSERLGVHGEVDPERAWADARPFEVAGGTCLALAPEDAIAYASTHWAQHHFFMSVWLLDIALMAAQPLQWDRLVRQAHADGTAHFLWASLHLVRSLFGAPVPAEVITALQPPFPKGALISHLVWEKALTTFHEAADARSLLLQAMLLQRWRWTLGSLAAGVFPTPTWLAQHYGAEGERASLPRLLWRHGRKLARLATGRR